MLGLDKPVFSFVKDDGLGLGVELRGRALVQNWVYSPVPKGKMKSL